MKFETFGKCIDRCESFIERRFAVALLFSEDFSFEPSTEPDCIAVDSSGVRLGQQVPIGKFFADFTLSHANGKRIAVECDGREFHAVTPEQVDRDKARDRFFAAAGWVTIRFTGSELVKDPEACALEARRLLGAVPIIGRRKAVAALPVKSRRRPVPPSHRPFVREPVRTPEEEAAHQAAMNSPGRKAEFDAFFAALDIAARKVGL